MATDDYSLRTEYTPEEIAEGLEPGRHIKVNGRYVTIHHLLYASSIPDGALGYFRLVLTGPFKELRVTNWKDLTQTYILTIPDSVPAEPTDVELFPDNTEGGCEDNN